MARKDDKKSGIYGISSHTARGVVAVTLIALSVVLLLAGLQKAGAAGSDVYRLFSYLLGVGYFLLPLLCAILGVSFLESSRKYFGIFRAVGGILFFASGLGAMALLFEGSGGEVGSLIATPLLSLFDLYAAATVLLALLLISLLIIFDWRLSTESLGNIGRGILYPFRALIKILRAALSGKKDAGELKIVGEVETEEDEAGEDEEEYGEEGEEEVEKGETRLKIAKSEESALDSGVGWGGFVNLPSHAFTPPPLSILEKDKGKPGVGDIKANANIIKRTLQNFGIIVEMDEISIGPTVTRYALKPAEGVKLSRIVGLQDNLALALAAHPIRIEAPIPGKSLVGVEIPNSTKTLVGLSNLLGSEEFQNSDKSLLISIGRGISGKSYYGNLAKMPHLLIAGATGSGKSVTIHALIVSLLYRNGPETLRFIMIDPKRVELTMYNSIPHLLTPVITDPKKTIMALKWAAKEMDRRYDILQSEGSRDIDSYHKKVVAPALEKRSKNGVENGSLPETMPYIVIIIDELADIMSTYPRELEAAVVRLAQMSRAVGIHLVLSTQRPSVNVITGLIKANIPARIALQVASQIDSRTILDMGGAEKLLGAGDMLYLSTEMPQPQRIQSAFITEEEVKKVVRHFKQEYKDEVPSEINLGATTPGVDSVGLGSSFGEDEDVDDSLYEESRVAVIEAGKASTSYLQRKLRIGYARAARIMDMLEERGVIGPGDGAKPREVLGGSTPPQNETPKENQPV